MIRPRMGFFYLDTNGRQIGPYTAGELRQLHLSGTVKPETAILEEGRAATIPFCEIWPRLSRDAPASTAFSFEQFTQRTTEDIRALTPHLLVPLQEIKTLRWIENRKLLAIAAIGLLPLFLRIAFAGEMRAAYWGLALYVSVLWAVFFYYVFPAPQVTFANSLVCFFATGLISIAILLMAYEIPPLSWIVRGTGSPNFLFRTLSYVFGVGVPEELCKALVLLFLARRARGLTPQTMLFYGLISGLGFGIYEGIDYQWRRNIRYSATVGDYYLLNMLRLTSLPFLHAIWSGIAGYFIAFAAQYPRRKAGLLVVAIGVPAVLHGLYDVFSSGLLGFGIALLSVLALYMYLAKSVYFEHVLAGKAPAGEPPASASSPAHEFVPPPVPPSGAAG